MQYVLQTVLRLTDILSGASVGIVAALMALTTMTFTLLFTLGRHAGEEREPHSRGADELINELNLLFAERQVDFETRVDILRIVKRHLPEAESSRLDSPLHLETLRAEKAARTSRIREQSVAVVIAIGGIAGLIFTLLNWPDVFKIWKKAVELVVPLAYAADPPRSDISFLVPYFLSAIITVMAISFVAAVVVALTTPSTKDNVGRRKTADNIIKMAGSFFVGFGMALMKY